MKHLTTTMLVAAILWVAAAPAARAEDEPAGNSAAEQAFRDAWWAETSERALDRALEGYRKATEAEGPSAVRARALYRMAVVLERIGRTDDAIRALERLAQDFADEADLQAKARDRLEEWTAVDLRTNFGAWYERYKYSPEFQGRIVELVLKLGGPADGAVNAGKELLVIGEATVPALTAHLDSPNAELRDHAVDLLLQLGAVPPVRHLVDTSAWSRTAEGWGRVLELPETARTRLLAELDELGNGARIHFLRALLAGPSGWARAVELQPSTYLIRAVLAAEPEEAVLGELRNLVPKLDPMLGRMLAQALLYADVVPDPTALGWLRLAGVREEVARRIQEGNLRNLGAWRAVVDAMNALPLDDRELGTLAQAFFSSLSSAPASVDLEPAVQAFERAAPSSYVSISGAVSSRRPDVTVDVAAVSRFLAQVADAARDPKLAEEALMRWTDLHRGDDDVSQRLIVWARSETTPKFTSRAAKYAGAFVTDDTLDRFLDALEASAPELAAEFAEGLRGNRRLLHLAWTDERVLRLHDLARAFEGTNATREIGRVFYELHKAPGLLDQLTRLALQAPTRVWGGVSRDVDTTTIGLLKHQGRAAAVRSGFTEAWPGWNPEERLAALDLFRRVPWSAFEDGSLASFLRAQLAGQWAVRGDAANEALEQQGKRRILEVLPTITLDDVRKVFDLQDPEEAAAAAGLARLERDAEAYDALAAARRAEDPETRWSYWTQWAFKAQGDLRRRVARDLAKDPWPDHRVNGIRDLGLFRNRDDVPLLVEALGDPAADVRRVAAETLAKVYDRSAIEALVKALDDPSPEVRDQVLETLEAIKQIEEKKAYWKELLIHGK